MYSADRIVENFNVEMKTVWMELII